MSGPVGPGPFPFGGAVPVSADLADIAARAAIEGCVNETVADQYVHLLERLKERRLTTWQVESSREAEQEAAEAHLAPAKWRVRHNTIQ